MELLALLAIAWMVSKRLSEREESVPPPFTGPDASVQTEQSGVDPFGALSGLAGLGLPGLAIATGAASALAGRVISGRDWGYSAGISPGVGLSGAVGGRVAGELLGLLGAPKDSGLRQGGEIGGALTGAGMSVFGGGAVMAALPLLPVTAAIGHALEDKWRLDNGPQAAKGFDLLLHQEADRVEAAGNFDGAAFQRAQMEHLNLAGYKSHMRENHGIGIGHDDNGNAEHFKWGFERGKFTGQHAGKGILYYAGAYWDWRKMGPEYDKMILDVHDFMKGVR